MILSRILERISLLYFVLSDLDDSIVDCREITAISRLFKEWNSAQDIPCPENALIKGRVLFRKYRKVQHPRFIFKEAVDFLGLHLTQANIVSLYDDLKQLADLDDILSPNEMEFLSILESQWQVELNSSIRGSKKLIAGHFCQAFRLNREAILSDLLRQTYQVDALLPLVKFHEIDTSQKVALDSRRIGNQEDTLLFPKIKELTDIVCETLQIDNIFNVFVDNDVVRNAGIWSVLSSFGHNFLILTSELINDLDDEELKFVIGHEIGHWMFNNSDLDRIQSLAYSDRENRPSFALQNLLSTWKKLAEFSADRIGLVACGSLETAISALYKVCVGLDPAKVDFNMDRFLDSLSNNLPNAREMDVFKDHTHPPPSMRLLALKLFHDSKLFTEWNQNQELVIEDTELSSSMNSIIDLLDSENLDSIESKRILAIALGGLVLSEIDELKSDEEISEIKDILRHFVLNPDAIIQYVEGLLRERLRNPMEMLGEVLFDLIHINESEKYPLFGAFIQIALSDGDLKPSETTLLFEIGHLLQLSSEEIFAQIARHFGSELNIERKIPSEVEKHLRRKSPFHLGTFEEKIALANDEATSLEDLEALGRDMDINVRMAVLFNNSTPDELRNEILDSPSAGQLALEVIESAEEDFSS